jgi:hypothetical protein
VDLSGAQYLPSKLRPNFSIVIIIALARGLSGVKTLCACEENYCNQIATFKK